VVPVKTRTHLPMTVGNMSYADAIARVTTIQGEQSILPTALDRVKPGKTSFADALAEAQAGDSAEPTASSASLLSGTEELPSTEQQLLAGVQLPAGVQLTSGLQSTTGLQSTSSLQSTGAELTSEAPLTSDQQQFASRLSEETGLDPQVISSWLLAEESGGAAQSRQQAGNNDWLNIGYTDSATYGSSDSVWSNPLTAAEATAGWLKGEATIPGYGTASSGVQAILNTAGQPAQTQIAAIQGSGWASSGYPDLPALYQQVAG
jgi:hypothetical protein